MGLVLANEMIKFCCLGSAPFLLVSLDLKPHVDLVLSQEGRASSNQGSRVSMVGLDSPILHWKRSTSNNEAFV